MRLVHSTTAIARRYRPAKASPAALIATRLPDTRPRRPRSDQRQPWLKLAALVLVVAALGLPINDLFRYALLVVATVVIVVGDVSLRLQPWLGALAAVGLVRARRSSGSRRRASRRATTSFSSMAPAARSKPGCRREAFRLMAAEFDAKYPPERRCDPRADGCWRGQGFPGPAVRLFRRRHLPAPGLFAAGDAASISPIRSGFASASSTSCATTGSRQSATSTAASRDRRAFALLHRWRLRDAVVRDVPLPRRIRRQRPVLARRGAVGGGGASNSSRSRTPRCNAARSRRTTSGGASSASRSGRRRRSPCGCSRRAKIRLRQLVEPALAALVALPAVLALLVQLAPAPDGAAARAHRDHARGRCPQRCELHRRRAPVRQRRRRSGLRRPARAPCSGSFSPATSPARSRAARRCSTSLRGCAICAPSSISSSARPTSAICRWCWRCRSWSSPCSGAFSGCAGRWQWC